MSKINSFSAVPPVQWGEADPHDRGPIVCMDRRQAPYNTLGNFGGQYMLYRALSDAAGQIPASFIPDYTDFVSDMRVPQNEHWSGPNAIASFDPFGQIVPEVFAAEIAGGLNIRPTIALTHTELDIPEVHNAIAKGRLAIDNTILNKRGRIVATKIAIEPVWYLPKIAEYVGSTEDALREAICFGMGGGDERILDEKYKVYAPPFGETTVYVIGGMDRVGKEGIMHAARTHDKCGSSDTHGATICSCRPALMWGYEEGVRVAQKGGVSIIVYTEAEGRGHGVVAKNGVYNARLAGPDLPEHYFDATAQVTGKADLRQQMLATDVYRWLGVKKVDAWMSGSPDKTAAMLRAGIEIAGERPLPTNLLPEGVADTEVEAKRTIGGYNYQPRAKVAAAGKN